jgi:DNA-binding response OmpR family regulator
MSGERRRQRSAVLIALPDADIAGLIARDFDAAGVMPCLAFSQTQILVALQSDRFRLLVLHSALADADLVALVRIAYGQADLPILILRPDGAPPTATSDWVDLELPYNAPTAGLVERGLALIQISLPVELPATLIWGPLELDIKTRQSRWNGALIGLTSAQFRIMEVLVLAAGGVVTWQQLSRRVWGPGVFKDSERILAHVLRIRKKLGSDGLRPSFLLTVRGEGYRLAEHELREPPINLAELELLGDSHTSHP